MGWKSVLRPGPRVTGVQVAIGEVEVKLREQGPDIPRAGSRVFWGFSESHRPASGAVAPPPRSTGASCPRDAVVKKTKAVAPRILASESCASNDRRMSFVSMSATAPAFAIGFTVPRMLRRSRLLLCL